MSSPFQPYLDAIDRELRAALTAPRDDLRPFYDMFAYHLGWLDADLRPVAAETGKRLRPLLCLLACEAVGGDWRTALPAAAALELVHNFSLVHDDIEDRSDTRRGRRTLWRLWGLPQGINAGDGMLVLGFQALSRTRACDSDPELAVACIGILHETVLSLCHGQYLDIAFEGRLDVSQEQYLEMIGGKTASLLAASAELGAVIGGARGEEAHYREFGWQLGMAFQMVDDTLGIWGNSSVTGKPAADDICNRKMTLPVIYALRDTPLAGELLQLYSQDRLSAEDVSLAVSILDRVQARQYTQQHAAQYEAGALAALAAAQPAEPAATHLRILARSLTERHK
jgi:geranylgeranyl diphosphate synthase type I